MINPIKMIQDWLLIETDKPPMGVPIAVCNKREEWVDIDYYTGNSFKQAKYPHNFNKPTHWYPIPIDFPI